MCLFVHVNAYQRSLMVQLWQEESVKDMETGMQGLGQVIGK